MPQMLGGRSEYLSAKRCSQYRIQKNLTECLPLSQPNDRRQADREQQAADRGPIVSEHLGDLQRGPQDPWQLHPVHYVLLLQCRWSGIDHLRISIDKAWPRIILLWRIRPGAVSFDCEERSHLSIFLRFHLPQDCQRFQLYTKATNRQTIYRISRPICHLFDC
jgi:hypothetical protein